MSTLQPGDQVPHFTVTDVDGREAAYSTIWQRRHLLLVLLDDDPAVEQQAVADLNAHRTALTAQDATVVLTRDQVPGAPRPGVLVADRWGEVQFVAGGRLGAEAPGAAALVEWLRYVQQRCPECEGESR